MNTTHISITQAVGTWVVRVAGAIIGESNKALELHEGSAPYVIYFPREDIEMAFLDPSDKTSTCPHKGVASYFTVVTKSGDLVNAAWSYEDPIEDVARIKGHLAFYANDKVAVEQL